jgi:hypothetical protein
MAIAHRAEKLKESEIFFIIFVYTSIVLIIDDSKWHGGFLMD